MTRGGWHSSHVVEALVAQKRAMTITMTMTMTLFGSVIFCFVIVCHVLLCCAVLCSVRLCYIFVVIVRHVFLCSVLIHQSMDEQILPCANDNDNDDTH